MSTKCQRASFPGLRYIMAVAFLLSTISTFNSLGLIYLMTAGGSGGATRVYSITPGAC
ncbi:MAG: sugar ABC transporter permease [Caldilineaceae bacterium]|nr:sugar ABC transporter permease [Caldilineaceae bacterium]